MHTSSIVALRENQGILRKLALAVLAFVVMVGPASEARAVTLTPSVASPQKLGTPITWTATIQHPQAGHTYGYQFSVTFNGQTQILSDFGPANTFTWTPFTVEGTYQFSVVARDSTTLPAAILADVSVSYTLLPWVSTPLAAGVVNPTAHPLVALFSGPPCAAGHQMLVRFRPATPTGSQNPNFMTTNMVPCSQNSANFYVAGMYPLSKYLMHWDEYNGTNLVNFGPDLSFTTGPLPSTFPTNTFTVNVPPTAEDAAYPVVLFQAVYPTATDLNGNVLWYFPNDANMGLSVSVLALPRMETNGYFYSLPAESIIQEYDLATNLVEQTNLEILNEQLTAKGYPVIQQFSSHEVRNLPDGNIGVLGIRAVKSTTAQGGTPTKPVTIAGDMVLVLNHNLQLVWAWDPFAHEDINRAATLGDLNSNGSNDWLHTNALQGTDDGNIILSQRSQDMVLKINYARGTGDGSIIWRMGAGLDFTITNPPSGSCSAPGIPGDPNIIPWFTHQHDAHFDFEDDASGEGFMIMTVFDDGNTRHADCPAPQNSRGMVMLVNEPAREITFATVADLGGYSAALGSAQLLTPGDGNIYSSFNSGILPRSLTQVSEVNLAGQIVYQIQTNQPTYRAYRMQNLYTTSEFEVTSPTGIQGVLPPGQPFDFSAGFVREQDTLQFNGSAALSGTSLELTNGGANEAGTVFYTSPVNVQSFTTDFTFQITNPAADGFTFTIQNAGPGALGFNGGALGYQGIGNSVALKFDVYQNPGDPSGNSTGIFVDGAVPIGGVDLTGSGINLASGDQIDAHITYSGTTLSLTLTDLVTKATWSHPFTINIPGTVGGTTAFVGFTGGTGLLTSTQQILGWSYEPVQVPFDPTGFPSGTGLSINGNASLSGTSLLLTNGGFKEASSAFTTSPVNIQAFATDFNFQLTNATADGFTFTIQNMGPTALGSNGGSLGYGGIGKSVAVKFDVYQNPGDPSGNSTGIFVDGALPVGGIDLTGTGINLHSGDQMHADIAYDGEALTLTITDLVTQATWSNPIAIDIPDIVGGNTAYVGFTAGTGAVSSTQQILNWTFE